MSVFKNASWVHCCWVLGGVFGINCFLLNLNTQLFGIDTKMGIFCMKRCSVSIMVREMQINITMTHHLTPVIISFMKKTRNKYWWRCGEKGPLVHWWWECILLQPLWKRAWRILIKQKWYYHIISNSITVYLSKGIEIIISKRSVPHVYCCSSYNIQDLETT